MTEKHAKHEALAATGTKHRADTGLVLQDVHLCFVTSISLTFHLKSVKR